MLLKLHIGLARFILSNWPFSRGIHALSKIMLFANISFPDKATFSFKYGKFENVSIKKWPWGYWDLYIYGVMERDELYFWRKLIRKGDIVIDVGANYGYWTLVASKLVGNSGTVLSFEPIDSTYETLLKNISASNVNNVTIYKQGLSNKTETTFFYSLSSDDIGSQSSQGQQSILDFDNKQQVDLVTLDGVIKTKKSVKLVKIDIEGGELNALKGMEQLLKDSQPYITFEWNILTAESMGYHPDQILSYLESLNYTIRIIDNKKFKIFSKNMYAKERVLMLWALPNNKSNK